MWPTSKANSSPPRDHIPAKDKTVIFIFSVLQKGHTIRKFCFFIFYYLLGTFGTKIGEAKQKPNEFTKKSSGLRNQTVGGNFNIQKFN
jgi:hypothetical protein